MTTQSILKFSRADYLNSKCTHREYYSQFVTNRERSMVKQFIGIDRIKAALAEGDEHLNTIPLAQWDRLSVPVGADASQLLRLAGDYPTQAGANCILKEAAKQLTEL
jgi:hypothetical protein